MTDNGWAQYAALLDLYSAEIAKVEADCRARLAALYDHRAGIVRQALAAGHKQQTIADHLGVTHSAIQKIRRRPLTDTGP